MKKKELTCFMFGSAISIMVMITENGIVTQVQILVEAICILIHTNDLVKCMNSSLLSPAVGK